MRDNAQDILLEESTDNGILRLILNDPGNKNALSEKMNLELLKVLYTRL